MLLVYLGIYTLVLIIVWGLFIISRIHSYKFKNFSHHIVKVTNTLFAFLAILSVLGYVFIFMNHDNNDSFKLDFQPEKEYVEINY